MARKSNLKSIHLWVALIILVAAIIRFSKLTQIPPSLYWEEAALGYDAYSILKTGRDYHGNFMPLVAFPSFGDFKPSLYFYTLVPSIAVFGLTDFAVRFPSALSGTAAVLLVFLIAKQIKYTNLAATLAALILAITPWHIQFSRAAFEVNLGVTLYLAAIYCLLKARQKPFFLFGATILFAGTMYAYHGFRVLSPLTALITWLYEPKKYNLKFVIANLVVAAALISPILINLKNPVVNQRFQETSFFPESQAVSSTNQLRQDSGNTLISRILYHRYWWWTKELLQNYLSNFHPTFLFLSGDDNQRHGVGEYGPLYHWQFLAVIVSIYFIINQKSNRLRLIGLWLLLIPIPVMLTKTNPHTLRMLPAVPLFALLSGYALSKLTDLKKYLLPAMSVAVLIIVVEFFAFSHYYTKHYSQLTAQNWQYGYQETIQYVESVKNNYPAIYFTKEYGRPSIYALFYGQYDPSFIQTIDQTADKDQQELLAFDKYIFTDQTAPRGSLVVTTPANYDDHHTLLKTIYFPDGKIAFLIYEQK